MSEKNPEDLKYEEQLERQFADDKEKGIKSVLALAREAGAPENVPHHFVSELTPNIDFSSVGLNISRADAKEWSKCYPLPFVTGFQDAGYLLTESGVIALGKARLYEKGSQTSISEIKW